MTTRPTSPASLFQQLNPIDGHVFASVLEPIVHGQTRFGDGIREATETGVSSMPDALR